jgi:hypothetical protein
VNEHTADRTRHHAAAVKGLQQLLGWLETDATIPVWDYLPVIIGADSAEQVARIAIAHDMPGPHTATDGSVYTFRAFGGGVTYQTVCAPTGTAVSTAEQRAHAWARQHGCVIVPVHALDRG